MRTGVGLVIHDHTGNFIIDRSCWYDGLLQVHKGESCRGKGSFKVVTTHNNLGIHLVRFETDAKYVVDVVTHLKWIT